MSDDHPHVSRRALLRGAGAAALFGALPQAVAQEQAKKPVPAGLERHGPGPTAVKLKLNGKATTLKVEPRVTLLDALRDRVGLTGTKRVCDRGACGGCTVWLDGRTVNSCMLLAVDAAGSEVTTIEGLEKDGELHPVQEAFVREDAMMCGFCTPGMVMSCAALCERVAKPSEEQVRAAVAGNLCRCGTYTHVFKACMEANK